MLDRYYMAVVCLILLVNVLAYFTPPENRPLQYFPLTSIADPVTVTPAGPIDKSFKLTTKIQLPERLLKKSKIYDGNYRNNSLCLDLCMANYNDRKNVGSFEIDLVIDDRVYRKQIKASSIRDNHWEQFCFYGCRIIDLINSKEHSFIIKGIDSPSGNAVTVWLNEKEEVRYKFSFAKVDNSKFKVILRWLHIISFLIIILIFLYEKGIISGRYNLNLSHKAFLFLYLTIFTLIIIWCFSYQLDLDVENIHGISKLFLFDNLLVEYLLAMFALTVLISNFRSYTFLGIIISLSYVVVNISQLISLFISGRFLTKLALDDIAFIGMLFNLENCAAILFVLCLLVLIPMGIAHYFSKRMSFDTLISNYRFSLLIVFLIVIIHCSCFLAPTTIIRGRSSLLKHNYFTEIAPVRSFCEIFIPVDDKEISLSSSEIKQLKELGFDINPRRRFPLLKDNIYEKRICGIKNDAKLPNVIVIFTEGFSSRTCAPYNGKFDDLTPNVKLMAEDDATLIVKDYYGHTAATYRGLHGQLCSLYPAFGGSHKERWLENKIVYKSLPEVLNHNGFDTIWLETNYENVWYISKMLSHFGINNIVSAEELSRRYLGGLNKMHEVFFTDHQSYRALTGFLKEYDESKPFFLGIYTGETHAWTEVMADGTKYKDGTNNSLNTIHNMDHAFGKFWKYFKASKYAKNTMLIFTSDHAHYYPKPYIEAMKQYKETDYRKVFIDKIPLLIYDPVHKLPKEFDANSSTSLDLAPTIIQMLGLPNEKNSFLGTALFDKGGCVCNKDRCVCDQDGDVFNNGVGIASFNAGYFILKNDKIFDKFNVLEEDESTLVLVKKFIDYLHALEIDNRIYPDK